MLSYKNQFTHSLLHAVEDSDLYIHTILVQENEHKFLAITAMISQVEGGPRNTVDKLLQVEAIVPLQQKLEAKVFVLQRG